MPQKSSGVVEANTRSLKNKGMSERDAVIAALTDMKKSPKQVKGSHSGAVQHALGELYPYGLQLSLEDADLEKLGLSDLPDVGESYEIHAIANVTSVSESSSARGQQHRCVSFQITKLSLSEQENADDTDSDTEDE